MLRQFTAAACLCLYSAYPVMSQQPAPDLILHHGKVVTVDLGFSAVAS